jgi:type II secretory pathway component GspD/PulD (secretin)
MAKTYIQKLLSIIFILGLSCLSLYAADTAPVSTSPQDEVTNLDTSYSPTEEGAISTSAPVTVEEGLARKISLDLRGIEIADVFKFLAKKGNLNIVTSIGVSGRINLLLNNVQIQDVIDVILLTNKLAYYEDKDIITIMTEAEYQALYGDKYNDKRIIKTIDLTYADAKKIGTILSNLKSDIGKVVIDEETGSIILIDIPEKIVEMDETAKRFDIPTVSRVLPTVTEVFELKHAKVEDIKAEIKEALTANIGSMRTDSRTNKLVITDLPHNMEKVRGLIEAFDDRTKQVFIEAKIIEVTLNDEYHFGVDWKALFSKFHDLTFDHSFPSAYTGTSKLDVTFGTFDTDEYEVALDLVKSVGDTRIISSPHIAVVDGEEAKFMVGSREAYVTSTTTTGEVTTTTSESVQFIDVGVNLYVTPTISSSGYVKLRIKPEISSVRDWLETTEGNQIPIVDTSNVETEVLVMDNKTVLIAGLIKETNDSSRTKVPILGDIPIAGLLFGNTKVDKDVDELIIFITPHIISGGEDYLQPAGGQKERKPPKE